jgi:hypothetical protein
VNLDEMPLDSPEHVRVAWHLVTGMDWKRHKAVSDGKPPPPFTPGEHELGEAMERIQEAATRHGIGGSAFSTPAWRIP